MSLRHAQLLLLVRGFRERLHLWIFSNPPLWFKRNSLIYLFGDINLLFYQQFIFDILFDTHVLSLSLSLSHTHTHTHTHTCIRIYKKTKRVWKFKLAYFTIRIASSEMKLYFTKTKSACDNCAVIFAYLGRGVLWHNDKQEGQRHRSKLVQNLVAQNDHFRTNALRKGFV